MGAVEEQKAVAIGVLAKDPKKDPKEKGKKPQDDDAEMSEEDKQRKEDIDMLVSKVLEEEDEGLVKNALELLATELRTATSSMMSVPKPLKFLRPHFTALEEYFERGDKTTPNKRFLADILSVLATTISNTERKCLKYRLMGTGDDVSRWGHEYMRNVVGELTSEWAAREAAVAETDDEEMESEEKYSDLLKLAFDIAPFFMSHNAECDAVDLLCEVDQLEKIKEYVDPNSFERIVRYLLSVANYGSTQEEHRRVLKVCFDILLSQNRYHDALRVAIKLEDEEAMLTCLQACDDRAVLRQMAFLLGRCGLRIITDDFLPDEEECSQLKAIMNNELKSEHFLLLAKELDVLEPKRPDDVYKTHLEERGSEVSSSAVLDSAKQNLASSFVNGFVNVGFCCDKLMTPFEDGGKTWIYRNKDHGMMSTVASLGTILMWNIDRALADMDRYTYSTEPYIRGGAALGYGIAGNSIVSDCDAVLGLSTDTLEKADSTPQEVLGALMALGLAYAGTRKQEVLDTLVPIVVDGDSSIEMAAAAALTLGLTFVGTGEESVGQAIVQTLLERQGDQAVLETPWTNFLAVGLGLIFLGQREACEATLMALEAVSLHPVGKYAAVTLEGMAYAASGEVLQVQKLMKVCVERRDVKDESDAPPPELFTATKATSKQDKNGTKAPTAGGPAAASSSSEAASKSASSSSSSSSAQGTSKKDKDEKYQRDQMVAVLSLPLVAMGEDVGSEMCLRMLDRVLQYGDVPLRRAVPLALALQSTSNPKAPVSDLLSKLSHDADAEVALNAIIGLGLVGAGTNNSRIAALLRELAAYYAKDANALFVVRLAQGLLYAGKGLVSLSPLHSDRLLVDKVALAGLLVFLHACLDIKNTILSKMHCLTFFLVTAIQPRMLITLDEDLQPLPVSVRVGQAVDVVGQAGRPKTITGFQTHTTPVVLSYNDRAELATEEYTPLSTVLEGVVILRKNPAAT